MRFAGFITVILAASFAYAADVVTPPTITQGIRGIQVRITLDAATSFNIQSGAIVEYGYGVEITDTPIILSNKIIQVALNIDCLAPLGLHTAHITNPDGSEYQSTAGFTVTLDPGRADITMDGLVDGEDLGYFGFGNGFSVGDSEYFARIDLNGDGRIDFQDLDLVYLYWSQAVSTSCNIP